MRISRSQRAITAAVMTTVATATVVTFARADEAPPTTRAAALPNSSGDYQPSVSGSPAPIPTLEIPDAPEPETALSPAAQPVPQPTPSRSAAPKPEKAKPSAPAKGAAAKPTSATSVPAAAPTPTSSPTPKNLLQLLGLMR